MLTRLWCAGILCPHPELKRFHFTCLYCRWRRVHYGKLSKPPYLISYIIPWKLKRYAVLNAQNEVVAFKIRWHKILIDPRGHCTMLRCAAIMTLDKIVRRWRWTAKPLMEFCEFLANYTLF
jgi:hypothetical protein